MDLGPYLERVDDFMPAWNANLLAAIERRGVSVAQVAAQLDIAPSTFYRRTGGGAAWPLRHFLLLSSAFGLSVGERLTDEHSSVAGLRRVLPKGAFSPAAYLASLEACTRLAEAPGVRLQVSSGELPVFYLFAHPVLTALKLYLFEHVRGSGARRVFDPTTAGEAYGPFVRQAQGMWRRYAALDRDEVWGNAPLASLLNQVESLIAEELLDRAELPLVTGALRELVRDLDDVIQADRRGAGGLDLRAQRIHNAGPIYRINCPDATCHAFVTIDPPNFLQAVGPEADDLLATAFARAWHSATSLSNAPGRWRSYREKLLAAVDDVERTYTK